MFAVWRRPWRLFGGLTRSQRWTVLQFGVVLAVMNVMFDLAVDRLPLATVSAIEFLGTIILAAAGTRTWRNVLALAVTIGGVAVLAEVRLAGSRSGSPSRSPLRRVHALRHPGPSDRVGASAGAGR